jgi:hypothetical protein
MIKMGPIFKSEILLFLVVAGHRKSCLLENDFVLSVPAFHRLLLHKPDVQASRESCSDLIHNAVLSFYSALLQEVSHSRAILRSYSAIHLKNLKDRK